MKPKAIIIDLDGTLCNTEHRQHHMQGEKKDWKAFYEGISADEPNQWCIDIIDSFILTGIHVLFVSGRPSDYYGETANWLIKHDLGRNHVFMRKSGDFRKDSIVKEELYQTFIEPKFDILFCIDDRQQVVDMWRSIGLTCLQCAKGDF